MVTEIINYCQLRRVITLCLSIALYSISTMIHANVLNTHTWHAISNGIAYKQLKSSKKAPWAHIHVFKINLTSNVFSLVTAKDLSRTAASIEDYIVTPTITLAINGGFFDKKYHPLGLRMRNFKQINPLKAISWWGVFYIKNHHPTIVQTRAFHANNLIEFAIQSGPRLIMHGQAKHFKSQLAERTALGITPQGEVIILITEHSPLSLTTLAKLMQGPSLNCIQALNLDGGHSTQLYLHTQLLSLKVPGFALISDAVIVQPLINLHVI